MKCKWFVLIAVIVMSGCTARLNYIQLHSMTDFQLHVESVPKYLIHETCVEYGLSRNYEGRIGGCAIYNITAKTCTIVVPEPIPNERIPYRTWGEEIIHCVKGNFHKHYR